MDRVYVMQLVRSFQVGEISRRTFLKRATAAVGTLTAANMLLAACSAYPNAAPPPVVDEAATPAAAAEGEVAAAGGTAALATSMVDYPGGDADATLMGYLTRPQGDEPRPAVVVIQEWWGLNDHIKDVANRFADEGYVTLAPDLYHGVVTTEPDEARKLVMELDMETAVGEIQSAIDFLQQQAYVAGDQVGIVGFCMGGGLVLATALAEDDLGAAVAFYGSPLNPDQAAGVKAPIMGHYGSEDRGIPVSRVKAMGDALSAAGIENEIYIYDGAQHAFFNDTRSSSYNADASAEAWARTLRWFADQLQG